MTHEGRKTHELHLVLDTEHLMLCVLAGEHAIGKLSDVLVARDDDLILGDLVGEAAFLVDGRGRKGGSLVEGDTDADVGVGADDRVDAALAAVALVAASELR